MYIMQNNTGITAHTDIMSTQHITIRVDLPDNVSPEKKQRCIELFRKQVSKVIKTIAGLNDCGDYQKFMKDVARFIFAIIAEKEMEEILLKHDICMDMLTLLLEKIEGSSDDGIINEGEYLEAMNFCRDFKESLDNYREMYIKYIWSRNY